MTTLLENEGARNADLRLPAGHGVEVFWRVPDLAAKIQIGVTVLSPVL